MGINRVQTATAGQPINIPENIVYNSVSGSWTECVAAVNRPVRVQGVYWSSTQPNAILQIRDTIKLPNGTVVQNPVWYGARCDGPGGVQSIDLLPSHLTLFTPFEYLDTGGGNIIVVYGEYA